MIMNDEIVKKYIIRDLELEECYIRLEFLSETFRFQNVIQCGCCPMGMNGSNSVYEKLLDLINKMVERYKQEIGNGLDAENALYLVRVAFLTFIRYMMDKDINIKKFWNEISPDGNIECSLEEKNMEFLYTLKEKSHEQNISNETPEIINTHIQANPNI